MWVIRFESTVEAPGGGADTGIMRTSVLRIGIAGCGMAARIHLDRLLALDGVAIVGCADPDLSAAEALADRASTRAASGSWRHAGPGVRRPSRASASCCPRRAGDFHPASVALSRWPWMRFRRVAMCSSRNPSRPTFKRRPISSAWPADATSRSASAINFGFAPAWSRPGGGSPTARSARFGW